MVHDIQGGLCHAGGYGFTCLVIGGRHSQWSVGLQSLDASLSRATSPLHETYFPDRHMHTVLATAVHCVPTPDS
jgi:hypothetical protein